MNSKIKIKLCGLCFSLLATISATTGAVDYGNYSEQYSKLVSQASDVSMLDQQLFGDEVSLYTGGLSFSATDVSLPGTGSFPMAVSRSFRVEDRGDHANRFLGAFGDWDLDIPRLHGVFASTSSTESGWRMSASAMRCAASNEPTDAIPPVVVGISLGSSQGYFDGLEYWEGNHFSLPGAGTQEMMIISAANPNKPNDGVDYRWVTGNHWYFSCLPTTANGFAGDAFLAKGPDGRKIWFNHLAKRPYSTLKKQIGAPMDVFRASAASTQKGDLNSGPVINAVPVDSPAALAREENELLATRMEDRFGNSIVFTYDSVVHGRLISMQASDGRVVSFTYNADGRIQSVSDGSRSWQYGYTLQSLTQVTLPDNSRWQYSLINLATYKPSQSSQTVADTCNNLPDLYPITAAGSITHPSGAVGTFTIKGQRHGRSYVTKHCIQDSIGIANQAYHALYPRVFDTPSILSKQISGTGITTPSIWTYAYGSDNGSWSSSCLPTCLGTKTVTVRSPEGLLNKYTFGNRFRFDEGRLYRTETSQINTVGGTETVLPLSDEQNTFISTAVGQAFPEKLGEIIHLRGDWMAQRVNPKNLQVLTQQGVSFTTATNSFDAFANPTAVTRSSASSSGPLYSRTDSTTYEHNLNTWVIGQVKSVTNTNTGNVLSQTDYDPITALPLRQYSFGQTLPDASFTYFADGNLNTAKDALNRTTTLSNYYRGVPRLIAFPDATSIAATVNPTGTIASSTDQLGAVTQYTYDLLGRMASIAPPTGDTVAWTGTTQAFAINTVAAYGLPTGHWKQTISKGNYRKEIYFNALWQPVVTREYDNSKITSTQRFTRMSYDAQGRNVFTSYPGTTDALTTGVRTEYDALGRVTKTKQDSELLPNLGVLTTTTEYLTGFQTRVTNPRGFATTTSYQVFDTPDTSRPEIIVSPEGMTTTLLRNVYGNTLSVTRSGVWNNAPLTSTRSYVYDSQQRLCKRIEPETGATLMDYDAVGNLAWSVQGSALTSNACDRASVAEADKTVRSYNAMNRLLATDVPGSTNDLAYDYFADGALKMLTIGTNRWDYTYNKLRLPVTEKLTIDSRVKTLTHAYNTMAQESSLTYPSGLVVASTPNALGQASQAGTFATGVSYYANSGMSAFVYGNGIAHTMTPNTRMLPSISKDMNGSIAILHDTYTYDANGNVTSITDGTAGAGGNRSMTYDNADRLIRTNAPNQWWINNYLTYDALDNIRVNTLGNRTHNYQYNATTQRLDSLTLPNATVARALAYDTLGNVTTNGAQSYVFDKANRMQSVNGLESYEYDGHGRRVKITKLVGKLTSYPMYSLDGKLITEDDSRSDKKTDYIYLNGSLVAKRSASILGAAAYTTTYLHTDALGSPVAESDAAKTVIRIERYTPYGEPSDNSYDQGPGFTGHVTDGATGLTYAQARYYDPVCGCFLSADPMASDIDTGWNFNRYNYAANNPYKFTDPDGRFIDIVADVGFIGYSTYKLVTEPSWVNAAALGLDVAGAAIPFATGLGPAYRAANNLTDVARTAEAAVVKTGNAATDGTRIHSQFDKALNSGAVRNVQGETAYRNGQQVGGYRPKGSSNPDAVLGNPAKPTATFDLKTGASGISKAQAAKAASNLPPGTPYYEVRSSGHNVPRPRTRSGGGTATTVACDQIKSCR